MNFRDTPDAARFRTEVRALIEKHRGLGRDRWLAALRERRWIAAAWPPEYGGAGLPVIEQYVLNEETALAGLSRGSSVAVGIVGPTIIAYGTQCQKSRFLNGILEGEGWCQGFSEPGAGSDLAAVTTRAERIGDEFRLNGQKIWTSLAHQAKFMLLLARTDPAAPKHRGLSYFIVDMSLPGIEVRPITNLADGHDFNEVFLDDVDVPADALLGDQDRGWYQAVNTLSVERTNISSAAQLERTVETIVDWCRSGAPLPHVRQVELASRKIETVVARLLSQRILSMQLRQQPIAHEASCSKLFTSELTQRVMSTGMALLGTAGGLRAPSVNRLATDLRFVPGQYLWSVANTIAGGTSEIQRNVIATRGLGIPQS